MPNNYQLTPTPRQVFLDANGKPLVGGLVYTYQAGTTTPQATYSDTLGASPNANPIVLDSAGSAAIYLLPGVSYKFLVQNASAVQQYVQDNVFSDFVRSSAAQTVQNKTLDDTNIIAVKDSNLTIEKAADATAAARFDASGITAGQTRVLGLPDASCTLAGQNLKNLFTKRQEWKKGANIVSANNLTLGDDGNSFLITGTTEVDFIETTNWQHGSIVVLFFNNTLTVKENHSSPPANFAPVRLQNGGLDFMTNGDAAITLQYDSVIGAWMEIARAASSSGQLLVLTATLTDAQIKALPTTPFTLSETGLFAGTGANNFLSLLQVSLILNNAAGTYTNVNAAAAVRVRTTSGNVFLTEDGDHSLFDSAANTYITTLVAKKDAVTHLASTRLSDNISLAVDNSANGNFTGGNAANTMVVKLTFLITFTS